MLSLTLALTSRAGRACVHAGPLHQNAHADGRDAITKRSSLLSILFYYVPGINKMCWCVIAFLPLSPPVAPRQSPVSSAQRRLCQYVRTR